MYKKIILTLLILAISSFFSFQFIFAQSNYTVLDPVAVEKIAGYYIAGIIDLAGGSVILYPEPIGRGWIYRVTVIAQPPGIELDIDFLNDLIDEVSENVEIPYAVMRIPTYRKDVPRTLVLDENSLLDRNIKSRLNDAIREFIETSLYEEYEGLKEKVNDKIEKITGIKDLSAEVIEFKKRTEFTKAIEGLLGHPIDPQNDADMGFLFAHINKLKKGVNWFNIADEINLFKLPLKDEVSSYIKDYSGEEFNVLKDTHSGILSFFSEWANSIDLAAKFETLDESIQFVSDYIGTLNSLKSDIQSNIYKGARINIFNFLESGIPSYFADLTLTGSSIDEVKSKIAAFGERMDEISSDADLKQAIQNYAGDEFSDELVSRFAAMVLGKSLSTEGAKVLRAWSKTVDDETAEDVLFNPINRAKKLEIVRVGRKDLSIDEVFNLDKNVYNLITGEVETTVKKWMVRLINNMGFVRDKVNERAKKLGLGEDYVDIIDSTHEAALISFAGRIVDLVDIDEFGHSQAKSFIAKEIAKLEKEDLQDLFPPAEQLASSSLPLQGASDTIGASESDSGIGNASTPVFGQDNGLFNGGLLW